MRPVESRRHHSDESQDAETCDSLLSLKEIGECEFRGAVEDTTPVKVSVRRVLELGAEERS